MHAILSSSLSYAVSWGWIEKNPAEYAHPPKLKRRRARPPTDEQVARLLNLAWETDVELAMFLRLATTLGARRGELTGLRWCDIDLKRAVIRIEMSYLVRKGQRQLKETKTDEDRRLPLDELMVQRAYDHGIRTTSPTHTASSPASSTSRSRSRTCATSTPLL